MVEPASKNSALRCRPEIGSALTIVAAIEVTRGEGCLPRRKGKRGGHDELQHNERGAEWRGVGAQLVAREA